MAVIITNYTDYCVDGISFIHTLFAANFTHRQITHRINKDGRFGFWTQKQIVEVLKEKKDARTKTVSETKYPDLQKRIINYQRQNLTFKEIALRFNVAGERFNGKYFRAGIIKKISEGIY